MHTALPNQPVLPRTRVLYGGLVLFCVITSLAGYWLAARGMAVRVLGWDSLAVVALGAVGMYLGPRTGFPHPLDAQVSARQRFLWPALVGVAFGWGTWLCSSWQCTRPRSRG